MGAPVPGDLEGQKIQNVSGNKSWSNVPNLNFNRDNRQVKLNADNRDNRNDNWAVPEFRERFTKNPPIKLWAGFART